MSAMWPSVVFLPGAGGSAPNLDAFDVSGHAARFEIVNYPNWRRCIATKFSAEALIEDLAAQIAEKIPQGPIRIVGLSIGGHFGYAAALHLEALGREIAGFCAIDSFMIVSSEVSTGWKGRAVSEGLELLRKGRMGDFIHFLRSKAWRAALRLAGRRLPNLIRRFAFSGPLHLMTALDPIFENELTMRLLIREMAPWVASLDHEPTPLMAPAVLIRTRFTRSDDLAWRRRCPNILILEIPGEHHSLFEQENIPSLRDAFAEATRLWQ